MFNLKLSTVCLERNFHRSFKNEMARHSSIFGEELQLMVKIGKEYGSTSNFDAVYPAKN